MSSFLAELPIVLGVLAAFFVGPAVAIGVLIVRKRRARLRRRSPIAIDLLRAPGYSLREQIEEVSNDLTWDLVVLMVLPLLVLALFLAQAHLRTLAGMSRVIPIYVVFALAGVAWVTVRMIKKGSKLDALRAGYDAEMAVGQELDQLMRQGAAVFHDFPADGFNVDHVVISRRGLFAVETKGYTKPGDVKGKSGATVAFDGKVLSFPRFKTKEPIEQAERQAQWLAKWATAATGDSITALPIVALPGWFVDRRGRGAVRVYSGRELSKLLDALGATPLPPDVMLRLVYQIEQRCRDVAPKYAG